MSAAVVLEQLNKAGVNVRLDGADRVLAPGSKVPTDLLLEDRAHKAELMTALSKRTVPADTGKHALLARLRNGQAWFTDRYDGCMDGTEPEGRHVRSSCSGRLETLLRRLSGYQGCIHEGKGCPPDAPVWCSACAAQDRETAP